MKKTLSLLTFAFIFLTHSSHSNDFIFEHLTIDDGLSNNTVNAVLRDHLGFMWFATNDGLSRYDGYDFSVYRHDRLNPKTLSNSRIHYIFEDSEKNLWVCTQNGLNLFNREMDNFTRFVHDPNDESSISHNLIKTVYEDSSGALWFGTLGGGLNKFESSTQSFQRFNFPDKNISDLIEDSNGNLWIATNDPSIILLNWREKEFESFPFPRQNFTGLKPNTLKTLYEDKDGKIWIGTEGSGLFLFNPETREYEKHFIRGSGKSDLSSNIVSDIMEFDDHTLWLATDGGGIDILDRRTFQIETLTSDIANVKGLSSNAVYSIIRDKEDVIWVGTFGAGINILNPQRQEFRFYTQNARGNESLSHKSVLSFFEDSRGNIWVGTDGGGLNLFDPRTGTFKSYSHNPNNPFSISSNVVTSILEDTRGNLWIGTFAGGLNRFDRETERFYHYKYNPDDPGTISSNNVWKLLQDSDGDLWIGTLDGLEYYSYENDDFERITGVDNAPIDYPTRIISLFEDSSGNIWLGSTGIWLFNKNDRSIREFSVDEDKSLKLFDYDIRDFHEDRTGTIYIATEGAGLIEYEPNSGEIINYSIHDGLPSDVIHQIIQDDEGILWLSTNRGIARFDREKGTFSNFNIHDGLQSNQFAYSASLYTEKGEIYFGGINGFNVFHPKRIKVNNEPPNVYITGLSLFNEPVEIGAEGSPLQTNIMETNEITLPYQSVFSFRYTAINYTATPKNQYKFKLEGFDEWNDVGAQRTATYTNIDPGKYTFRVKASNNDGVWNDEGASITINILPPFWRTGFAYALYIVLFITVTYFIFKYVINRQKYKHDLMIKDLEKAKIEEISQVKLRFFTNIAHEFRTPLTLILGPIDKIMHSQSNLDANLKKQLTLMGRNAGRLLRLVNELMEFRKIEMGRVRLKVVKANLVEFVHDIKLLFDEHARMHDIDFNFECEDPTIEAWFDKEKMEKVIYNILSNSFKFTPDRGVVEVKVSKVDKKLANDPKSELVPHGEIVISDNGIGIPEKDLPRIFERFYQVKKKSAPVPSAGVAGTGIGLALSRELVEFHKGDIEVKSKEGMGTTFKLCFPLDKRYFDQDIVAEQDVDNFEYKYSSGVYGIPHAELSQYPHDKNSRQKEAQPVMLFIDDNPDMRAFVQSTMEEHYNIVLAENGVEGMEKAVRILPDIIVSDVMMPEMDGIEMCQKLKKDMNTSHLPLILLTAKVSDDYTMEGFDAGADDYLPKPFNPRLLHSRVQNILENRKQLRQLFKKEGILQPNEVSVTSADEKFLRSAMEVVERNIGNPEFRVSHFVNEMNMSRSVLYRKFEALTGQSVNEFVRNTRLTRATQLLVLNELTISEITYEVGFNDPQYFSKCFSKKYGMTPSEYAKKHAEKKTIEED